MTREADGRTAPRHLELVGRSQAELRAALADGDRALHTDGDLPASRSSFDRAYRLAEQAADADAMALAVLGLAGLWVSERRTVTGAVMLEDRLEQVLALLGQQSLAALRIRARLAAEADYRRGEHAAILALLGEARAAADPVAVAEALSLAHHCVLGPDDLELRGELAFELIRASFRTGRRSDRLMGLMWQTIDAYCAGDPHAGRLLDELRAHLTEHDHPAVGFVVSAIEVMLAIRAGRLADAEELSGRCASSGAAAGDIDAEWWPGGQLVTIRWYQGRLPELLPLLRERVDSAALSAVDNSTVAALAVAAALHGDRPAAASCLASLCGGGLASLPRSSSWLVTMNGVVETAYLLGDADVAAAAYDLLRPHARLPMVGGLGVTCFGSTHQALGIASLTSGDPDRAVDHLRAAVRHNLALGHWPAVVSARQRLAVAHRLRGEAGDADAADRELEAAGREAGARGLRVPAGGGSSAAGPGPGTGPGAGPERATCERAGRGWRVALRDRSVLVPDSIGMLHLAVLIANPRQDIPAYELAAGLASLGGSRGAGAGAGQRVLDQRAVGEYRSRLRQIDAEIDGPAAGGGRDRTDQADQADRADRAERAAGLLAEREWLVAQLATAAGLGGRARSFPDESERARVAVGKAIRRAIGRVAEADEPIGAHLRQRVHTGARCSYWPG